ncbi:hypothetical protein [Vibrio vulnificus]|uniref:hypothetical protein n=1 Tax=Vibrio vulnificus TaxID=672 RepID=UPI0005F23030|nr:hypothetical protein [Vibrio vulnificus]
MYGQYMFLVILLAVALAGCNDDKINGKRDGAKSNGPNALGNLIEIKMLPPEGQLAVPANSKMKLRITGLYENGTLDLTEQAEMRILNDVSNITFTEDNQIQAGAWNSAGANETRIIAEFEDLRTELTVNVMEGVCEESLTVDQVEALDGACVMSYTYDGKMFLFSPRKKFMDGLGYTASDIAENEGRTYARIHTETYPYALFRRDGKGMARENFQDNPYGQAERFCKDLAQMSFSNKSGWKMATLNELQVLMAHHRDNGGTSLPLGHFTIWAEEKRTDLTHVFAATAMNLGEGQKIKYAYSDQAVVCRSE